MSEEKTGWKAPAKKERMTGGPKVETSGTVPKKSISVLLPITKIEEVKKIVDSRLGYRSVNQFINKAIDEKVAVEIKKIARMEKTYEELSRELDK